jgi:hypothetical protein
MLWRPQLELAWGEGGPGCVVGWVGLGTAAHTPLTHVTFQIEINRHATSMTNVQTPGVGRDAGAAREGRMRMAGVDFMVVTAPMAQTDPGGDLRGRERGITGNESGDNSVKYDRQTTGKALDSTAPFQRYWRALKLVFQPETTHELT